MSRTPTCRSISTAARTFGHSRVTHGRSSLLILPLVRVRLFVEMAFCLRIQNVALFVTKTPDKPSPGLVSGLVVTFLGGRWGRGRCSWPESTVATL
jgi:hypothetical protein